MQNLGGQTKSILVFSEVAYRISRQRISCKRLDLERREKVRNDGSSGRIYERGFIVVAFSQI